MNAPARPSLHPGHVQIKVACKRNVIPLLHHVPHPSPPSILRTMNSEHLCPVLMAIYGHARPPRSSLSSQEGEKARKNKRSENSISSINAVCPTPIQAQGIFAHGEPHYVCGEKDHFHLLPLVGRIASPLSFVPKIPVDTLADPLNPKG